jgi:hypothetical protein
MVVVEARSSGNEATKVRLSEKASSRWKEEFDRMRSVYLLQGRQVVSYTKALDALMVFGGSAVDANWLARSFAARHPVLLLRIRLW